MVYRLQALLTTVQCSSVLGLIKLVDHIVMEAAVKDEFGRFLTKNISAELRYDNCSCKLFGTVLSQISFGPGSRCNFPSSVALWMISFLVIL